jgi:hypothetical protein
MMITVYCCINIRDDPGETNNLAKRKPELAAKLRGEMDEWQEETRAPIPTVLNPEYDLSAKALKR